AAGAGGDRPRDDAAKNDYFGRLRDVAEGLRVSAENDKSLLREAMALALEQDAARGDGLYMSGATRALGLAVAWAIPAETAALQLLADVLPGARVVSEDRTPLAPGELPVPPRAAGHAVALDPDALAQIQDLLERRWLDESVPALGGLRPGQAADDPTRRDELARLIVSFPDGNELAGAELTMRPTRLRELLGL
ncbi:MAG: hypothetical protein ACRD0D_12000, partial [Acidimicrobiales bacterium]